MRKIYSKYCWIDSSLQPATLIIDQAVITEIHSEKHPDAEDLGSSILMPGVIDAHVHVNEPGRSNWEGFETATQAAAAGGITTLVDMPLNASPVTTTLAAFHEKLEASKGKMNVNCGFYGGLIPGNTDELEGLIQAGVLGIKCFLTHSGIDEFPNVTVDDLELAMPILAKYKMPLLVHCELDDGFKNNLEASPQSYDTYLASRPKIWENNAVALMIDLCRKFNCPIHIVHVSSAEALALIENAKKEGLPITAETCIQYLLFSAEEIPNASTIFKCAPPIREKENNVQLIHALISGVLDFIATDHSPAPPELKEIESGNLLKAWGGIAGIQFLLPAAWTALRDYMSIEQFIPLLTQSPAKSIGVSNRKGKIALGFDADLVIWNPDESFVVEENSLLFKHKISPYIGHKLYGSIDQTIVNGFTVYQNKSLVNFHKGQWLIQ